jgi:hypothetical protein
MAGNEKNMADKLDMMLEQQAGLRADLKELSTKQTALNDDVIRLVERTEGMASKMEEIHETLFGHNGSPGLKLDVQKNTSDVVVIEKRCATKNCGPWQAFLVQTCSTLVSGAVIGIAIWLLLVYTKIH